MKTIAQQLNIKEFPFIIKDEQGNRIYFENSDGDWYKREFDEQGNKVYYEDSDGYWYKREFDEQGNKVYYEDSDGYWCKREYNEQGNEIYSENSDGVIEDYRKEIIEVNGIKYKRI